VHKLSVILVTLFATFSILLVTTLSKSYEETTSKLMWSNDTLRLHVLELRHLLYDCRNPKIATLANTENSTGGAYVLSVFIDGSDKRAWITLRRYNHPTWGFYQCNNSKSDLEKVFPSVSFTCTQEKLV